MVMKQQSAIEFIITYSLALLVLTLFIVSVLLLSDFSPPANYLGSSCNIQPLLPCSESLLTYNAINPLQYYVVFANQLGEVMYFPQNSINVTTTSVGTGGLQYSLGSCNPAIASYGSTIVCEANVLGSSRPHVGSQTQVSFSITYKICSTSNVISSCGIGYYKSTGTSSQNVAPSNVKLNLVGFSTALNGTIVLNGVTYFNNTNALLISGSYSLFGIPASGHAFNYWSVSGSNAQIACTMTQNAILTLNSNAVITANFV